MVWAVLAAHNAAVPERLRQHGLLDEAVNAYRSAFTIASAACFVMSPSTSLGIASPIPKSMRFSVRPGNSANNRRHIVEETINHAHHRAQYAA